MSFTPEQGTHKKFGGFELIRQGAISFWKLPRGRW